MLKKTVILGGKVLALGGSYTRRERGFAAQAPLSGPICTPACRSVLAHAASKKYPSPHQVIHPLPSPLPTKSLQDTRAHITQNSSF
jgi:hypothetical protein